MTSHHYDVIIIGAGAAGMMCGIEAGKRGRRVLILDHAPKIGAKILISGGDLAAFCHRSFYPEGGEPLSIACESGKRYGDFCGCGHREG